MRIYSKRPFSKRREVIVTLILLAIVGLGVCAYYINQSEQDKAKEKKQTTSETNNNSKQDIMRNDKSRSSKNDELTSNSTTTSDQVPVNPGLSISIISVSQANGIVKTTSQTNSDGTCVFLYQPGDGGKPVVRQVNTSNSSCSVNISENEFSYLGQWKLTATLYKNDMKAEASQNVTIN